MTSFTTSPCASWDVWVGPGPEPGTGRMLGAARWRNHYHAERVPDADARWLTTTAEGGWLRAQAVRDLAGRVLGCSRGAHGLILARLADGVDPDAIREELREFALETAPLLGGEA